MSNLTYPETAPVKHGIEFSVERMHDCFYELAPMASDHWSEVAYFKDKLPLCVDWSAYWELDHKNLIHLVTARLPQTMNPLSGELHGELVGYWIGFLVPTPFYASTPTAHTSLYYLKPEHRKGRTGICLFKFVEKSLRERGIKYVITSTKIDHDAGHLFEHLGWKETERVYAKWIGE